jgi:hypothetical protein
MRCAQHDWRKCMSSSTPEWHLHAGFLKCNELQQMDGWGLELLVCLACFKDCGCIWMRPALTLGTHGPGQAMAVYPRPCDAKALMASAVKQQIQVAYTTYTSVCSRMLHLPVSVVPAWTRHWHHATEHHPETWLGSTKREWTDALQQSTLARYLPICWDQTLLQCPTQCSLTWLALGLQ